MTNEERVILDNLRTFIKSKDIATILWVGKDYINKVFNDKYQLTDKMKDKIRNMKNPLIETEHFILLKKEKWFTKSK